LIAMNQLLTDFYLAAGFQPYTWLILLGFASLLDALTTIYALRQPGMQEANPVMRWVMNRIGVVAALLLVKGLPLLGLFFTLQDHILYVPLGVLLYLCVAGWNVWTISRSKADA